MLGIGKPVAILAKKSDDVASFKTYEFGAAQTQQPAQQQQAPQQSSKPSQEAPKPATSSKSYPTHGMLK